VSGPLADLRTADLLVPDAEVVRRFAEAGQGHVFRFLGALDEEGTRRLIRSARNVSLEMTARLASPPPPSAGAPAEPLGDAVVRRAAILADRAGREAAEEEGRALLRKRRVAVLTMAGGQGTRLGWPGPKGCYPIGPGERTLFDLHAEAVAAATREAGAPIPWVILVSPSTEEATREHFLRRGFPGIEPISVRFVCQGVLPVLDDAGKLLLEAPDRIAVAPDGHGGSLQALRLSGTLAWLVNLGVEEISCFQVDNPLAPPADPLFLGLHRRAGGQMSTKVFLKADPAERVGVVVRRRGRPAVIEYMELPREEAERRDASGGLVHWAANMASHAISLPFAAAVAYRGLPVHRVRRRAPFLDEGGKRVEPAEPNAWKFETFLFDALPMADKGVVLEVDRDAEFAPVKNAEGADSPETARALLRRAGRNA
jgi:UDP-N-acetylglucosamine/UDP-N-acetylgalactosamine diphosphorylase